MVYKKVVQDPSSCKTDCVQTKKFVHQKTQATSSLHQLEDPSDNKPINDKTTLRRKALDKIITWPKRALKERLISKRDNQRILSTHIQNKGRTTEKWWKMELNINWSAPKGNSMLISKTKLKRGSLSLNKSLHMMDRARFIYRILYCIKNIRYSKSVKWRRWSSFLWKVLWFIWAKIRSFIDLEVKIISYTLYYLVD